MKELIGRLQQQAHLSEEQAHRAAEVIRSYLGERLPESLRGPVESALTGENVQGAFDQARGLLGGLLGGDEKK